jgi:hypothetical protein
MQRLFYLVCFRIVKHWEFLPSIILSILVQVGVLITFSVGKSAASPFLINHKQDAPNLKNAASNPQVATGKYFNHQAHRPNLSRL